MKSTTRSLFKSLLEAVYSSPLSQTLPLVLRLAREVGDKEFEKWLRLEINGYFNQNPAMTKDILVPEYRTVGGRHHDIYGRPLIIQDPRFDFINSYRLRNGIEQLEKLSASSETLAIQDLDIIEIIRQGLKVEVNSFSFSPIEVTRILSIIRSTVFDWLYEVGRSHPEILDEEREETTLNQYSSKDSPQQVVFNIGNGTTLSGGVNISNSINDSFNKGQLADVPQELKDLLKDLAKEVGKISNNLPQETAEEAVRDLETFTAEATSSSPRKRWWQLSAEGLKQAAKNVGEIGEPVLKLVTQIVALLSIKP